MDHHENTDDDDFIDDLIFLYILPKMLCKPEPIPQHNSILTGKLYVQELLDTYSEPRFRNAARIIRI